jgi:uncharacterized protein
MDQDRLKVSILSQDKIRASWHIQDSKLDFVSLYFGKPFTDFRKALRIYDVTHLLFNGNNAHDTHEFIMRDGQELWTIKAVKPNRTYCLELGILLSDNEFFPLLRSNSIQTTEKQHEQIAEFIYSDNVADQMHSTNHSLPIWTNHVSTYSYYETAVCKGEE